MSEDAAHYFTNRGFLTWKIQDATMRMQSTPDPELKKHWARVMNEAKKARGDFDAPSETTAFPSAGCDAIAEAQRQIIQTPERAREALRVAADQPGERHDD